MSKYKVHYIADTIDNTKEEDSPIVDAICLEDAIDKIKHDYNSEYTNYAEIFSIEIIDVVANGVTYNMRDCTATINGGERDGEVIYRATGVKWIKDI